MAPPHASGAPGASSPAGGSPVPAGAGRGRPAGPSLLPLLKPYRATVAVIVLLTAAANALNLVVPRLIAQGIDAYAADRLVVGTLIAEFVAASIGIFVLTYLQNVAQTLASERVARDLRTRIVAKLATQDVAYIQRTTTATLLTNLTSDVDAVKLFVSLAVGSIVSSIVLIIGAAILLLSINWQLGLAVLAVLPVIAVAFRVVMGRVRTLFGRGQQAIDWLNKVINESILGAALIRLVHSQHYEYEKFVAANTQARDIGLSILRLFASLIPIIIFCTNLATLTILTLGGHYVISGAMTIGDFTAFNSYLAILIFPVIVIGFMSNVMAQAGASYGRISRVLDEASPQAHGTLKTTLRGDVAIDHVTLKFGEKTALKDVTLLVKAGTRTAVIGPTAAGKTQLLYLLTGLITPTSGRVEYDGHDIGAYDSDTLHRQVGFVFQDATMFNLTLRENIGFSRTVRDADLEKAIATAELAEFVGALPQGLETVVSERGTSLSGGQKQRIMLARALALNPRVLLLDDFTARVDTATERKILDNVQRNYPGLTLLSVTQKIAPVEDYDQIVLLMEGEVLASGTHDELMDSCPEYVQIYDSQRSTQHYESVQA
ncbi:MAG TPA: ABC transporter ATP-binding protein [Vicinamibacterales bacterium]|nr:ABC transporter ATP-binding protein [Vicinamibacterales bacterium]